MGQYYMPVLAPADGEAFAPTLTAYSHDFSNGLKLMEHSWVGNNFVARIEEALLFSPMRLVWAGDYADPEPDGRTLYEVAHDVERLRPTGKERPVIRYVVNHDRQEYVDLEGQSMHLLPGSDWQWVIHPLPLLTVEGNGRGGGDYHGDDMEHIGRWARQVVSVQLGDWTPPSEFSELAVRFQEGR